jgi:hypothetical protein
LLFFLWGQLAVLAPKRGLLANLVNFAKYAGQLSRKAPEGRRAISAIAEGYCRVVRCHDLGMKDCHGVAVAGFDL